MEYELIAAVDLGSNSFRLQVGRVVGEHPVVLLGHPAVERAQASLEVRHRDMELHRGDRAGEVGRDLLVVLDAACDPEVLLERAEQEVQVAPLAAPGVEARERVGDGGGMWRRGDG